jgi:hypothetical protein
VHCGDRGLPLVRTDRHSAEDAGDECHTFLDLSRVPQITPLFGEWDEQAIRVGPRDPLRIGQQQKRE